MEIELLIEMQVCHLSLNNCLLKLEGKKKGGKFFGEGEQSRIAAMSKTHCNLPNMNKQEHMIHSKEKKQNKKTMEIDPKRC